MRTPGKGAALVGEISGGSVTFGSPVDFDTVECTTIDAVFDSINNKVVVGYRRYASDGTKYHHARVGTVDPSNNSITFGAAEPINTNGESSDFNITFDPVSGKIIVAYRDEGNSNYGTAKVGTVTVGASPSNDTISFGSAVPFYSGQSTNIAMAVDTSNNRIALVSQDYDGSQNTIKVRVGQISGTSITFGSPLQIYNNWSSNIAIAFDPSVNKIVLLHQNSNQGSNPYSLNAYVGTINAGNNTINFGSAQQVISSGGCGPEGIVYDSGSQQLLIVYGNGNNSWRDEYLYATVDESNDTINFGSPTVIGTEGINNGYEGVIYDSNANQSLIFYQDYANSRYGTYQLVGLTGFPVPSVGTPEVFNSSNFGSSYNSAVYDSTNQKVVIAYSDGGNSYYGTAIVGEVSGTGITFGTPTVFEYGHSQYISAVHDSSNNKIVIAYRNYDSSSVGKAIVGEIFENSISFPSSPGTYESDNTAYNSATYTTSGKVVVAYTDFGDNGYGKAAVGTVTGTSISFGSSTTFKAASQSSPIRYIGSTYDSTNNKVVIGYRNDSNSNYGEAIVGEVSGNGISFPSSSVPFNYGDSRYISPVHDSSNNKIVISYTDGVNNYYGTAIVGEVSGTSISFPSSSSVFNSANTWHITAVYDPTNQKVVTAYQDSGNSNYGTAIIGTVSGTGINFDSPVVFESAESQHISATYTSTNNKVIIAYLDFGNSSRGTAVTFTNRTISNNLTSENFIGISNGAYADGETATIQIAGAVDDAQSGLTPGQQYYVQNDGTLSETADSPSVLAGTAVAATKLIIG